MGKNRFFLEIWYNGATLYGALVLGVANLLQLARYTENIGPRPWIVEKRKRDMAFVDQVLSCRDCNEEFTFTVGEQEFFAGRGLTNAPTRCPACRAARKQSGGGRSGGRNSGGGSREREPRQMYSVTCASCGNAAQVPFLPRGDKPVYCGDCYQAQSSNRRPARW